MTLNEQIPGEVYNVNDKIKAYVVEVQKNSKGIPQMIISRTHPGFVRRLFELEIPEIYEGLIEIKNIVRENLRDYIFYRTKRNPMIIPIIMEV